MGNDDDSDDGDDDEDDGDDHDDEEYLVMVQGWLIIVMLTNENGIVGPDKTF